MVPKFSKISYCFTDLITRREAKPAHRIAFQAPGKPATLRELKIGLACAMTSNVATPRTSLAEQATRQTNEPSIFPAHARGPAVLVLADGSVFHGLRIGAQGLSAGEVVFNTAMTGYQEMLTDPSYCRQLITLTYPHVGNVGTNSDDAESSGIFAAGLIVRDVPRLASSWRNTLALGDYLEQRGVCGISDIDTRKLTRRLRETGAQNGCILAGPDALSPAATARALAAAQAFAGLAGQDLAKVVSCTEHYQHLEGSFDLAAAAFTKPPQGHFNVVAFDFGVKRAILRLLVDHGCNVTVVPAQTSAQAVLALKPDGVFLSNGPGDPAPCDYAISAIQTLLARKVPIFGICLGHQLLALAAGAKTVKMKFGHHGANHPVQDIASGRVMISSQNHGFAVDEASLPNHVRVTHRSLFDGSNQGIELTNAPAFSFQGHPEASPGPRDVEILFAQFAALMKANAAAVV
jgi:carbamoyl-phosphate synthase small subunit